ncbi:uncharacterized protein LOC143281729 [Babylonia areolata]|uniref:uncharacterized protein LOC143281729 n=1 Tax=Babylonia areolata TaxID=304850 RepID=UPI003FD26D1B
MIGAGQRGDLVSVDKEVGHIGLHTMRGAVLRIPVAAVSLMVYFSVVRAQCDKKKAKEVIAGSLQRTLTSPNFPQHYPRKADCKWLLRAPSSDYIIRLDTLAMDMEATQSCIYDSVSIFDGETEKSPLIRRYCVGFFSFKTTGPYALVVFKSDENFQATGFKLRFFAMRKYRPTVRTTVSTTTAKAEKDEGRNWVNTGALIGGVVGGVCFVIILGIVCGRCVGRGELRQPPAHRAAAFYHSHAPPASPPHEAGLEGSAISTAVHMMQSNNNTVFMMSQAVGGTLPPTRFTSRITTSGGVTNLAFDSGGELSAAVGAAVVAPPPPCYTDTMLVTHPPAIPPSPRRAPPLSSTADGLAPPPLYASRQTNAANNPGDVDSEQPGPSTSTGEGASAVVPVPVPSVRIEISPPESDSLQPSQTSPPESENQQQSHISPSETEIPPSEVGVLQQSETCSSETDALQQSPASPPEPEALQQSEIPPSDATTSQQPENPPSEAEAQRPEISPSGASAQVIISTLEAETPQQAQNSASHADDQSEETPAVAEALEQSETCPTQSEAAQTSESLQPEADIQKQSEMSLSQTETHQPSENPPSEAESSQQSEISPPGMVSTERPELLKSEASLHPMATNSLEAPASPSPTVCPPTSTEDPTDGTAEEGKDHNEQDPGALTPSPQAVSDTESPGPEQVVASTQNSAGQEDIVTVNPQVTESDCHCHGQSPHGSDSQTSVSFDPVVSGDQEESASAVDEAHCEPSANGDVTLSMSPTTLTCSEATGNSLTGKVDTTIAQSYLLCEDSNIQEITITVTEEKGKSEATEIKPEKSCEETYGNSGTIPVAENSTSPSSGSMECGNLTQGENQTVLCSSASNEEQSVPGEEKSPSFESQPQPTILRELSNCVVTQSDIFTETTTGTLYKASEEIPIDPAGTCEISEDTTTTPDMSHHGAESTGSSPSLPPPPPTHAMSDSDSDSFPPAPASLTAEYSSIPRIESPSLLEAPRLDENPDHSGTGHLEEGQSEEELYGAASFASLSSHSSPLLTEKQLRNSTSFPDIAKQVEMIKREALQRADSQ